MKRKIAYLILWGFFGKRSTARKFVEMTPGL
jgi:hypothetical protein